MYENETLSVAIYLANAFTPEESNKVFGWAGDHIYNKWVGFNGSMIKFICSLDTENYAKLIDRACSIYNGRSKR